MIPEDPDPEGACVFPLSLGPFPLSVFMLVLNCFILSYHSSSVTSSCLHTGQLLCSFNQGWMHSGWYRCLFGQGNWMSLSPFLKSSLQTAHADSSDSFSSSLYSNSFNLSTTFFEAGGGPLCPPSLCRRLNISINPSNPIPKSDGSSRWPPNEPIFPKPKTSKIILKFNSGEAPGMPPLKIRFIWCPICSMWLPLSWASGCRLPCRLCPSLENISENRIRNGLRLWLERRSVGGPFRLGGRSDRLLGLLPSRRMKWNWNGELGAFGFSELRTERII